MPEQQEEKKEEKKDDGEPGYFTKLITQVIDNVQIFIDRVHIRYEGTLFNFPLFSSISYLFIF
jgi:hypothetical protein